MNSTHEANSAGGPLPLVTIMVPWIGREKYIAHAVATALNQDYPNLEILISDNSLSVRAKRLLRQFDNERIRIVDRSSIRLDSSEHFNACLHDARGEYVMILSDDDCIERGYVSSMYRALMSCPNSKVCLGEQIAIDEADMLAPDDSGAANIRCYDGLNFLVGRLVNPKALPIITYVSLFARRQDMLHHKYSNYPDGSNADNMMMFALALSGKVAVSSKKMHYRIHETSAGLGTSFEKLLASCILYEKDAATLLRNAQTHVRLSIRLKLRILLRVRNTTVMARRLFTLYRRRMSRLEFLSSLVRILGYACGFTLSNYYVESGLSYKHSPEYTTQREA